MQSVEVWVYDISNGMGKMVLKNILGIESEGIWHTSVIVYGREYYFQGGIKEALPGSTHFGVPLEKISFGKTNIRKEELTVFLKNNSEVYTEKTYDLFKHNCNHFTDAVLVFLVNKRVPQHIMNLAQLVQNSPFGELIKSLMRPQEDSEIAKKSDQVSNKR